MKIRNFSKFYTKIAGRYGTVAVDLNWLGVCGIIAFALRKAFFGPVKEDTRAELVDNGYTLEEISQAEDSVKNLVTDGISFLLGDRGKGQLPIAEDPDVFTAACDEDEPPEV